MSKNDLKDLFKIAYTLNGVTINHCLIRDDYPTEKFVNDLTPDQVADMAALFRLFCENKGELRNGQKFKKLETYYVAILEFKTFQVRLAGFWREKRNFNLLYGLIKKRDDWPARDLNALRKNYDDFIATETARAKALQPAIKAKSQRGKR